MTFERSTFRIDEVAIVYDSLHKSPKYIDEGKPMVRVRDLKEGFLEIDETACVSEQVFNEFSKKHKPRKGDIIFSRVGSYGITSYVNTNEEFCLGQNTVVIVAEEVYDKFLYYSLIGPSVKEQIEKFVTGSTQKTISMKSINSIEFQIPEYKDQIRIGDFLYNIDSKIQLNNQIISNLEELAQTLFKRWFVDFQFPNENGEPYKSSGGKMVESELGLIPEGWSIKGLDNIFNIVMGQSPKSDTYNSSGKGLPLINGASDFKNGSINPSKYTTDPKKVTQAGDLLFGVRATVGNVTVVENEYAIGRGAGYARTKQNALLEFGYFSLVNIINYLENTASGSVYINISKNDLTNAKIVMPSKENVEQFHRMISSSFERKTLLYRENEKLKELRDTLLPKLLSGEVEIPDDSEVNDDVPVS